MTDVEKNVRICSIICTFSPITERTFGETCHLSPFAAVALALIVPDDEHSTYEQRFHIIGESSWGKIIVISYHEHGDTIRIISARKPTRIEQSTYQERN